MSLKSQSVQLPCLSATGLGIKTNQIWLGDQVSNTWGNEEVCDQHSELFVSDLDMDEKYFVYKFLAVLSPSFIFCRVFMIFFFFFPLIFTYLQYLGV